MFNANFLFASLVWGSVGFGYFIYGKKQGSWIPLAGGLLMMIASYFVSSALLMSLLCIALIAAVHLLLKLGHKKGHDPYPSQRAANRKTGYLW